MTSSYREEQEVSKNIKRGVLTQKERIPNKKKKSSKGPWKVVGKLFNDKDYTWYHCKTKELAERMVRKHTSGTFNFSMRIEYKE